MQAPIEAVEGAQHPDRDAQFQHINAKAKECNPKRVLGLRRPARTRVVAQVNGACKAWLALPKRGCWRV